MAQDVDVDRDIRLGLTEIIAVYRKETGQSVSAVSRMFYGHANFLELYFADKHSITTKKLKAFLEKLSARWPKNAVWPTTRAVFLDRPKIPGQESPSALKPPDRIDDKPTRHGKPKTRNRTAGTAAGRQNRAMAGTSRPGNGRSPG